MIKQHISTTPDASGNTFWQAVRAVNLVGYNQDGVAVDLTVLRTLNCDTLSIRMTPRALVLSCNGENVEVSYDCDALRAIVAEYGSDCGCRVDWDAYCEHNSGDCNDVSEAVHSINVPLWLCVVACIFCLVAGFIAGKHL